MTRKEQIKILNDKIKSNINQYKIDRLNAEISAFSSGHLNKYEFLTRKDLKYKPNALDKAKFEFSPLGKAFSTGSDKTAEGYQEEGVIKLLKDIRDGLAGGVNRPNRFNDDNYDNDNNNDNDENDDNDRPSDNKLPTLDTMRATVRGLLSRINVMKRESDSYLKTIDKQNDTIARIIKEFENSQ